MMETHAVLSLLFLMNLGLIVRGQAEGPVGEAGDQGRTSCGGVVFSGSGVITSPNYPRNYTNNINCTYIVTAASGGSIELAFNSFDLETAFDFLTISSGGLLIGRFTGSTKPPTFTLGNVVALRFTTDYSVVKSGFSIRFTTLEANCRGLIVGSGFVSSPGYPSTYYDNLKCVWGLVATQGRTLTLDFQSFNIEQNYDWLELYDGNSLVARYTASTVPPRVNIGSSGRIVFTTDSSVHYSGFRIAVNSAALSCGGLITGYASISSPNYPNSYPANASCTWTYISYTDAICTRIVFTAFNLEDNYDFVKIYDGATPYSSNTGAVLPPVVDLRSATITVIFTSDLSIQLTGFRLQFFPMVIR